MNTYHNAFFPLRQYKHSRLSLLSIERFKTKHYGWPVIYSVTPLPIGLLPWLLLKPSNQSLD